MPISALQTCLLLFSLSGLIDEATCNFPKSKDTFKLASRDMDFLSRARSDATKRWADDEQLTILSKIDHKEVKPEQHLSEEYKSQELDRVFDSFEKISALLQDAENHSDYATFTPNKLYSVIFNLSDIFFEHLAHLAKYNLIEEDTLKEFINNRNHLMIIYHYLSGRFIQTNDITSIILNQGLEFGLEEIPFTEDIKDLFKSLGVKTYGRKPSFKYFHLTKQFEHLTTPESLGLAFGFEQNLKPLAQKLVTQLDQIKSNSFEIYDPIQQIMFAKIYLGMLNFLKRTAPNQMDLDLERTNFYAYHGFKELEETMGYFSDALKLVYTKYVNTVQRIAKKRLENSTQDNYMPSFTYLTKLGSQTTGSPYSCKARDDEAGLCAALKRRSKWIFDELLNLNESEEASIEQLEKIRVKMEYILKQPVTEEYLEKKMKSIPQIPGRRFS
ncbi:uncharacterized protein PGTG_16303 [Puccinia graminis f. sp. tritici CRL 75-36-700-3]|uniref:Uncharacterized protein n=1 Tax=Puccinia graminis f. sp. tritici (strain CRL 75-36-700-3 / race SCCL) TaxID=418459 RepID=E3L182_PUCGT|nr:uncharacterized protein PGTG_16303 [Puccinia graminis f. sp. tritici CRL 75-36-700-3]EFP90277.1 hypothetical protein PGTG_16303 [Puccinia graminis f. sp. tritici CRL 75-36-700-3]